MEALIGGFCSTVHKMQGSEAPAVITPLVDGQNSRLLSRNLIYTAQTRAKEMCVVVGNKDVVRAALGRDGSQRNTTLDLRVEKIIPRLKARWERAQKIRAESADDILFG
jgi:exodeoxyribonuclease V alpha subunit